MPPLPGNPLGHYHDRMRDACGHILADTIEIGVLAVFAIGCILAAGGVALCLLVHP